MIFRQCPDRPSIFFGAAINQVGGTTSSYPFWGLFHYGVLFYVTISIYFFFSAGFYTQYRNAKPCYPYIRHYLASLVFLPSDDPAYREKICCQVCLHFIRPEHISWTKKTQSVWHVVSRQTETCSRLRKYFSRASKDGGASWSHFFVFQQESRHILPFIPFIPFLFCADSAARYNRQIKRLHSNSERKFSKENLN